VLSEIGIMHGCMKASRRGDSLIEVFDIDFTSLETSFPRNLETIGVVKPKAARVRGIHVTGRCLGMS
jgi:hypothetical protein